MNKEYRYNSRTVGGYLLGSVLLLGVCLLCVREILMKPRMLHEVTTPIAVVSPVAVFPLMFLAGSGVLAYIAYRLAGTSFVVTEEAFVSRSWKRVMSFPLQEVLVASQNGIPCLRTRLGNSIGGSLLSLRECSGLLAELKQRLDAKGLSGNYNAHELDQGYSLAEQTERVSEFVDLFFGSIVFLCVSLGGAFILGYVVGVVGKANVWVVLVVWLMFSAVFWFVCLVTAGYACARTQALQTDGKRLARITLDSVIVKKFMNRYFLWGSIAYVLIALTFMARMHLDLLFSRR